MIHIDYKPAIDGDFLIFEFEVDNLPTDEIIMEESNYFDVKPNSRNIFDYDKMHSNELKPLVESFNSNFLYAILNKIYELNPSTFGRIWPLNEKRYGVFTNFLKEQVNITTSICMDTPGWELKKHFDNRFVFANFILNLVDNPVSTKFYDYRRNDKLIYEATYKKGTGILFINYENTYHSYKNDSFKNRYALISCMNLNIS
jgi:hypothetical protein